MNWNRKELFYYAVYNITIYFFFLINAAHSMDGMINLTTSIDKIHVVILDFDYPICESHLYFYTNNILQ